MVSQVAPQPPITLRVSVTDRCDLRCLYCLPPQGASPLYDPSEILAFEEIVQIVRAVTRVAPSVALRITGGEPLLRPDINRLVSMLCALEVSDIALTTSGQLLAALAPRLKESGLRRVNVSLDTLQPERYARLTRGGSLQRTLAGIESALEHDLRPVKLNAIALRGINEDEFGDLARFAIARGCQMRFIELMPIGPAVSRHREWFVPADEVRARLQREFEFVGPLPGPTAPARTFAVRCSTTGLPGVVGFISPMSDPFCSGCRRLRLTSRGELLSCLMHGDRLDLRPILRNGRAQTELESAVRAALARKSVCRTALRRFPMAAIGG